MYKILSLTLALLFTPLWISACSAHDDDNIISTTEAYQVWSQKDKSSFVFLDVRTPDEYQDGHIPGAINMPIQTLSEHLKNVPKNKPLYLYCESGVRASRAASLLRSAGFKQVYNYEPSMRGWRKAHYPIATH